VEAEELQNEQERAAGAATAASLYNELEAGDIDAQRLLAFVSSYRKKQGAELDGLLNRRTLKSASSEHLRSDDPLRDGHHRLSQQQQQQLEAEDEEEARLFDELEQAVRKTAALHGLSGDAVSPQRGDASRQQQQQRVSAAVQQPATDTASAAVQHSPSRQHRRIDSQQQQQQQQQQQRVSTARGASPVVHRPYSGWRGTDVEGDVDTDNALQFDAHNSRQNNGVRQSAAGTTTARAVRGLHVQAGSTPSYALPTKHFRQQRRDGEDTAGVTTGTGVAGAATAHYAAAHERDHQVSSRAIRTVCASKLWQRSNAICYCLVLSSK
jgi:hypothetical protein